MKIESFAFKHEGEITSRFTCDGEDINPELFFKDVPKEAKSLALIMDDPDAPGGTWTHWVLWNISPKITKIDQNSIPKGAFVGSNSSNKNEYQGPCPPSGIHRYFFKLYALNIILDLSRTSNSHNLMNAIQGHILAEAKLMGKYKRK